jgi:hypothetical protein
MSTQAGTIEAPSRQVGFMVWGAIVSVLAAAALIMSAVALTQSARTSSREIASVAPLWDAGKLEAMRGRVLAETRGVEGTATLWDPGKLEAMRGRAIAG